MRGHKTTCGIGMTGRRVLCLCPKIAQLGAAIRYVTYTLKKKRRRAEALRLSFGIDCS
jgi:hypothetical protein